MRLPLAKPPAPRANKARAALVAGWGPSVDLDYPQWLAIGKRLGMLARCSQWWLGDWLLYGTRRWGERYTDAANVTGYDVHTLRNMVYVASRFSLSRRRDNLTWSHHAAIASLPPEEQDGWLDQAVEKRFSVADLRLELRVAKRQLLRGAEGSGAKPAPKGLRAVVCPRCGLQLGGAETETA